MKRMSDESVRLQTTAMLVRNDLRNIFLPELQRLIKSQGTNEIATLEKLHDMAHYMCDSLRAAMKDRATR